MHYIDIGANLTHESFASDLAQVLLAASEADVRTLIVTGSTVTESQQAATLAAQRTGLYATAGVHPHYADDYQPETQAQLQAIVESASRPGDSDPYGKVIAIGECGLDYHRNFSTHSAQLYALESQLELACKLKLPVFLHERDAFEDFYHVLARYHQDLFRWVVHCFTGTQAMMEAYVQLGAYIGVTGWVCDERRGQSLQAAVPFIPADRLVIETDAPYLLPRHLKPKPKGRRNEPQYLPQIAVVIAELRNESVQQLKTICWKNTQRLFDLSHVESLQFTG